LSGRKLRLPKDLQNPNGKFRIGIKRAINLFPKSLQERITKEKIEKEWEPNHKLQVALVAKKLQEFEAKNGGANGCKELTGLEKLAKDDIDAQVRSFLFIDQLSIFEIFKAF
jgi:tripeptidyl-peptidase-2